MRLLFRLIIATLLTLVLVDGVSGAGQKPFAVEYFSPAELETAWHQFLVDRGGNQLTADAQRRGLSRQTSTDVGWGFRGTDAQGRPVLLCVWTLEPKASQERESGAMLWVRQGGRQYKAYLAFPEKMADLEAAHEWFAGAGGEVQRARSWHSCFRAKLRDGTCESECATRASHTYCYPNAFSEFYSFHGRVRLFNLRQYLDCMAARCGARAACLLSVALECGYATS